MVYWGMTNYTATTEGITVTASPIYLDGQSDVMQKKFVFAYSIRIENNSDRTVQLLRRHWIITDGDGDTKDVEGEGVVGKQPVLEPGQKHEYNSFCVLETFEGSMEGTFLMSVPGGGEFRISIPRFRLAARAN